MLIPPHSVSLGVNMHTSLTSTRQPPKIVCVYVLVEVLITATQTHNQGATVQERTCATNYFPVSHLQEHHVEQGELPRHLGVAQRRLAAPRRRLVSRAVQRRLLEDPAHVAVKVLLEVDVAHGLPRVAVGDKEERDPA